MDSDHLSYENAVYTLNNLQSNAQVLDRIKKERIVIPEKNVLETAMLLELTGLKVSDLDGLKVIHVSGTKGKGSTCAFAESMLRQYGFKTGFFSSPHLVHVRERIRIDGRPISESKFASYFWKVYALVEKAHTEKRICMPAYFKFLTILAMHVFMHEQVDVAIVEVGIGGAYDCTNVFRKPVVCGISTLDLDHCAILGDTLEEIAWNKAGIFKQSTCAVTVQQPQGALSVLCQRAEEIGANLYMAPELPEYIWSCNAMQLGIAGKQQHTNASLALQLVSLWMQNHHRNSSCHIPVQCSRSLTVDGLDNAQYSLPILPAFQPSQRQSLALSQVKWPGRSQIIRKDGVTYFLDGAHTPLSIQACAEWFVEASLAETPDDTYRILLFQCTGDRCPSTLLPVFQDIRLDEAIFCPAVVDIVQDKASDQANLNTSYHSHLKKCSQSVQIWNEMNTNEYALTSRRSSGCVQDCITSAIHRIADINENSGDKRVQVLVTGSLHLVGGVLSIIQSKEELEV